MPITTVSPLYLKLIRRLPLRPIRTDAELDEAVAVSLSLDERGRGDLTPEERDYHDVLVTLIAQYEEEHHPVPDVSGVDMLHCLIENRELTQAAVAKGSGISEPALSDILAGRRPIRAQDDRDPGTLLPRGPGAVPGTRRR